MRKIAQMFIVLFSAFILLTPAYASAQLFDGAKNEACKGASFGGSCNDATPGVNSLIKKGLNLFSAVIGIIAVVMIMIGGIKYVTSQGDAAQTNAAKNTILYAAVGLVVAALAQVIVQFVLGRF